MVNPDRDSKIISSPPYLPTEFSISNKKRKGALLRVPKKAEKSDLYVE